MKKIKILIGGTLLAIGCGCFLYPNFREWNTQREVNQIIETFDTTYSDTIKRAEDSSKTNVNSQENRETVQSKNNSHKEISNTQHVTNSKLENDDNIKARSYQSLYDEMVKYNQHLSNNGQHIVDAWSYEQEPFDLSKFDINTDEPVIGYIEIPDMKIRLPLMLGASPKNLEKGAAVLSETSMPIGGNNTNCVIAGHRGWSGSAYFQYIENMKKGSQVYITNPWETLIYECTDIKVISPNDVSSILIQPEKDMITLFTCHPYVLGGGPYRYLVFCERIDTQERHESGDVINPKEDEQMESSTTNVDIEPSSNVNSDVKIDDTASDVESEQIIRTAPPQQEDFDLLALEQTLRYLLPAIIITLSITIILFRKKPKKKKNNKTNKKEKKI